MIETAITNTDSSTVKKNFL